jgi:hypothetical protein
VVVDVDVDVVVDGDGDGDDLATQLGQHGDNPSEELGSLLLFALVDNAEDVESVDDCGALHGRAPRNRVCRAQSASEARPAASAMLSGTDNAARRSCSARAEWPFGRFWGSFVERARNSMAHR